MHLKAKTYLACISWLVSPLLKGAVTEAKKYLKISNHTSTFTQCLKGYLQDVMSVLRYSQRYSNLCLLLISLFPYPHLFIQLSHIPFTSYFKKIIRQDAFKWSNDSIDVGIQRKMLWLLIFSLLGCKCQGKLLVTIYQPT